MTEPKDLAGLIAELKAAIAKRETAVGEAYLQATSAVLNLAPRLVKAAEKMQETLMIEVVCTCHHPSVQIECERCITLADADRIAAGKE